MKIKKKQFIEKLESFLNDDCENKEIISNTILDFLRENYDEDYFKNNNFSQNDVIQELISCLNAEYDCPETEIDLDNYFFQFSIF